jgi:hypothetical protein
MSFGATAVALGRHSAGRDESSPEAEFVEAAVSRLIPANEQRLGGVPAELGRQATLSVPAAQANGCQMTQALLN